jgi:serine/threonine-protein kinase
MTKAGGWIFLMGVLLLLGYLFWRFHLAKAHKSNGPVFDSADSNRLLGLALQGQGKLDQAFERFRKCPMDGEGLENLYNLGLDYERQRQFGKADEVFRHMAAFDAQYRDLPARLARRGLGSASSVVQADDGRGVSETPVLAGYRLEKVLGQGAMGVVYQGLDLKFGRVVAIKTMELAQEFEPEDLAEVKARFFREAETVSRLSHPNIVAMYDAGEAGGLAYMAMEYLEGQDLVANTKPGGLLPLPQVLSIIARVAEALDYAHRNNVVHRDIKPANIMYEAGADQVKVTDFGIARLTDSSRTRTGMVLGTPSYMSPEQLAGSKVDGRSDLFSLGVTLYQLCCGQLPFIGESLAQLMYKIANEEPVDIRALAPDLPDCVLAVVGRALVKSPEQRYQRGGRMALELRDCLQQLPAGGGE